MDCEEIRVDLRTVPHSADRQRSAQLLFRLNHTLPFSEEYNALLRELLGDNLGEGSTIAPPLSGAALDMLKIGSGVFVNSNLLAMARGASPSAIMPASPPMSSCFPTTMTPMIWMFWPASRSRSALMRGSAQA